HGIGSGPQAQIPEDLFSRLGLTRDKAEEALHKVLDAEVALRELAAQFHPHH
ncbi:MAG: histidine kinase, partial [Pseudomonas sp.]|nr:histidine kinase [Pseudomonas sp.]